MIPFRVLTGNPHPHFTVINESRLRHLDAFVDLLVEVLKQTLVCLCGNLLKLVNAAASSHPIPAHAA
jgi:hypothetical protein